MLETSNITNELKRNMISKGYYYLDMDMKIRLLKESITDSISSDLKLKDDKKYDFNDVVSLLDCKTRQDSTNEEVFWGYINSTLNIVSEMQGVVITKEIVDGIILDEINLRYDDYGFISKMVIFKDMMPSKVLTSLIDELENRKVKKLLVK